METVTKAPKKNTKLINLINKVVPEPMSEKEFNELSQSEKAVMVAKDALDLLESKLVKPCHSYLNYNRTFDTEDLSATSLEGKCHLFSECVVCAKGALFISTVMRTNKMLLDDITRSEIAEGNKVVKKEKVFTKTQWDLIEAAYEGFWVRKDWQPALSSNHPARKNYFNKFRNDTDRLAAILINIIRNKGKFVPTKIVKLSDVKRALAVKK